ncbi:MAG: hypothetical protein K0R26_35 [Bacteroidota bacterium]|jgi:hypothetical protein|nr:hypothetical protein [Bacteroidota bacterium]
MISIVICHRNEDYLNAITQNISKTIGIEYELIVINNQKKEYSIFEAYNLGVERSKFNIICFSHEDLLFHTEDWGQKVVSHFRDEKVGMIGVIGGNVFPKSPSPWWSSQILNDHLISNIQHWQKGVSKNNYQEIISQNGTETVTKQYNNPTGKNVVDAVIVDGLWFCIRKELFNSKKIRFDDVLFKSFHCYDTDISLQVKQHLKVCVVYDILVEHFQQGTINQSWFESVILLNRKWRDKLPLFEKKIDIAKYPLYEWETLRTFVYWMESNGYSEKKTRQLILEIYPLLPRDVLSKKISSELILRVKFSKFISRFIIKFNRLFNDN